MGSRGWCASKAPLFVEISDIVRKMDPCRLEMFEKIVCIDAADGAVRWRRMLRSTDANFQGIWSTGLEVRVRWRRRFVVVLCWEHGHARTHLRCRHAYWLEEGVTITWWVRVCSYSAPLNWWAMPLFGSKKMSCLISCCWSRGSGRRWFLLDIVREGNMAMIVHTSKVESFRQSTSRQRSHRYRLYCQVPQNVISPISDHILR